MKELFAKVTLRMAVIAAIALMLIAAVAFGVRSCDVHRSKAAQSRVGLGQSEAHSASSADAINAVAASGEASAASEDLTRSNEKEIRNAKGANAPVDPAARDAGLASLCRRAAYRDDPKCRLLKPHS